MERDTDERGQLRACSKHFGAADGRRRKEVVLVRAARSSLEAAAGQPLPARGAAGASRRGPRLGHQGA